MRFVNLALLDTGSTQEYDIGILSDSELSILIAIAQFIYANQWVFYDVVSGAVVPVNDLTDSQEAVLEVLIDKLVSATVV